MVLRRILDDDNRSTFPRDPVVPSQVRWDWGGCQEGPSAVPEKVRLDSLHLCFQVHTEGDQGATGVKTPLVVRPASSSHE